jgi:hypothetical protein
VSPCRRAVMPVIVPLAVDPASLVSTHQTRHTGAIVATAGIPATVAIPATLTREPEFFQSAWDALAPLLLDIGHDLIEHHGFQAAGEVRIAHGPVTLCKTPRGVLLDAAVSSSKDPQLTQIRPTKASCLIWSSRRTILPSVSACPRCLRTYRTSCRMHISSSEAITPKTQIPVRLANPRHSIYDFRLMSPLQVSHLFATCYDGYSVSSRVWEAISASTWVLRERVLSRDQASTCTQRRNGCLTRRTSCERSLGVAISGTYSWRLNAASRSDSSGDLICTIDMSRIGANCMYVTSTVKGGRSLLRSR